MEVFKTNDERLNAKQYTILTTCCKKMQDSSKEN